MISLNVILKGSKKMKKDDIKLIIKSDGKKYSVRLSRNRIFFPDEWNSFIKNVREGKKDLFEFLINTGARVSEGLNVKKEDIDFKNKTILLRVVKKRCNYSIGKKRIIPISSQYLEKLNILCSNLNNTDYLFISNLKEYSTKNDLKKEIKSKMVSHSQMMKRVLKKSKVKDYWNFSLHNIRKTTECWLSFLRVNYLVLLSHFGHNQSTALKHYLTTDIYNNKYKFKARQILGDLYI